MKVLFLASEVAPFSENSRIANLLRTLPDKLTEDTSFEARILMPRYGVVSERRNRLHEVIRLSGTEIPVGAQHDTLRVKVASIPGIRLQVYFVDSTKYFKRKGIYKDKKNGAVFEDNIERALYFARAALSTTKRLGWEPEVIHAAGWIAGLVPLLLRNELAEEPLFSQAKIVYTPDATDHVFTLKPSQVEALGLPDGDRIAGRDIREVGALLADAVVYPPDFPAAGDDGLVLPADPQAMADAAAALYRSLVASSVTT